MNIHKSIYYDIQDKDISCEFSFEIDRLVDDALSKDIFMDTEFKVFMMINNIEEILRMGLHYNGFKN